MPSPKNDRPVPPSDPSTQGRENGQKHQPASKAARPERSTGNEPPSELPSAPPAVDVTVPVPASPDTHQGISSPIVEAVAGDKKDAVAEGGNSPAPAIDISTPRSDSTNRTTESPLSAERRPGPVVSAGTRSGMSSGPDGVPEVKSPDSPTAEAPPPSRRESTPSAAAAPVPASTGWVVIRNSGKLPTDGTESLERATTDSEQDGNGARSSRVASDSGSHSARRVSVDVALPEPRSRGQRGTDEAALKSDGATGSVSNSPAKVNAVSARVESVPHVVERDENFWTISRLYYNSGRYYKALWKANADKHPDIGVLHVGDVIIVPPVEDLDSAYFVTARAKPDAAPGPRRGDPDRAKQADAAIGASESPLSLSAVRRVSRQERGARRDDNGATGTDRDSAEPEVPPDPRSRKRTGSSNQASRSTYKVRPFDTLRSIARDTVGDPNRAAEILELNRELIADPAQLTAGQVLNLPDDARTGSYQSSRAR